MLLLDAHNHVDTVLDVEALESLPELAGLWAKSDSAEAQGLVATQGGQIGVKGIERHISVVQFAEPDSQQLAAQCLSVTLATLVGVHDDPAQDAGLLVVVHQFPVSRQVLFLVDACEGVEVRSAQVV